MGHKKTNIAKKLDFPVENQTGKPITVVCFTYQKKAKGTWIAAIGEIHSQFPPARQGNRGTQRAFAPDAFNTQV